MNWLLKTEPSTYSWTDLAAAKKAVWDGVANALALKHMREMKKGEKVLIYHTGDEKAVVGIAEVVKEAYPDPKGDDPKMVVVEIKAVQALKTPVELAAIKGEKGFAEWGLVKMGRLSVVPTSDEIYAKVVEMGS